MSYLRYKERHVGRWEIWLVSNDENTVNTCEFLPFFRQTYWNRCGYQNYEHNTTKFAKYPMIISLNTHNWQILDPVAW